MKRMMIFLACFLVTLHLISQQDAEFARWLAEDQEQLNKYTQEITAAYENF